MASDNTLDPYILVQRLWCFAEAISVPWDLMKISIRGLEQDGREKFIGESVDPSWHDFWTAKFTSRCCKCCVNWFLYC